MHRRSLVFHAAALLALFATAAAAQRYSGLSSPPTAPPLGQSREARPTGPTPVVPVSTGMGPIQFYPVNFGVAAPQSLLRQLSNNNEAFRRGALAAIGAPSQYTQKGNVPYPHSMVLELAALSNNDDQDALLTVELDHHLVTAVMMPDGDAWRRVATVVLPTAFTDTSITPSTFLRTTRSLLDPSRYRAIFRARENQANSDYVENEAHLRIINGRAVVTESFVDESKVCTAPAAGGRGAAALPLSCEIVHRWLQPDLSQPSVRRFQLVTASASVSARELQSPLATAHDFLMTHLRTFTCQPFTFSDANLHYKPTGPSGACRKTPSTR